MQICIKYLFILFICIYSVNCIVFRRLAEKNYQLITTKIKKLFSNEPTTVYYIPTVRKQDSPSAKSINAKGKLVDKAKNLIAQGGYARYTKKRKAAKNTTEIPAKKIGKIKIEDRNKKICYIN